MQMQNEAHIFPPGPGSPRFGGFGMPTYHRAGVGAHSPSSSPRGASTTMNEDYWQQRRARFAVAGAKLSAAQIQELKTMMSIAAQGLGPDAVSAVSPQAQAQAAPASGGGSLEDVMRALAKASADRTASAKANATLFNSPSKAQNFMAALTELHPFAQEVQGYTPQTATSVGPNPTNSPYTINPYAQQPLQAPPSSYDAPAPTDAPDPYISFNNGVFKGGF